MRDFAKAMRLGFEEDSGAMKHETCRMVTVIDNAIQQQQDTSQPEDDWQFNDGLKHTCSWKFFQP